MVLEKLTEQKSAAQVSREYGIKNSVLSRWKQGFIERSPQLGGKAQPVMTETNALPNWSAWQGVWQWNQRNGFTDGGEERQRCSDNLVMNKRKLEVHQNITLIWSYLILFRK